MEANIVCIDCIYLDKKTLSCKAFPYGLPNIIISGESDHSEIIIGQDGDTLFTDKNQLISTDNH